MCTAEVDVSVDSPVAGLITWLKSGSLLIPDNRTIISSTTQPSTYAFQSILVLSSASIVLDSGPYTCVIDVNAIPSSVFVQGVTHSVVHAISLQGISCMINLVTSQFQVISITYYIIICNSAYNWC